VRVSVYLRKPKASNSDCSDNELRSRGKNGFDTAALSWEKTTSFNL
jgi:hypothetical protein